jgi:hypothetical protein
MGGLPGMGRFSWSLRTEPSIKRPSSTSGSKSCSTVSAELAGIPYRSDPKCGEDEMRMAFSVALRQMLPSPPPATVAIEPAHKREFPHTRFSRETIVKVQKVSNASTPT